MSDEFDNILAGLGGVDHYLRLTQTQHGLTAVVWRIESRLLALASSETFDSMIQEGELKQLLIDAVQSRSFELARQYIIRKLSGSPRHCEPRAKSPKQSDLSPGLKKSFKRTYVGAAVDGLYDYLTRCDTQFSSPKSKFYGRFLSIVQSSGTGKSRTISQLMQTRVLGLYMNVRLVKDTNSYPKRDDIPADILTENLRCSPEEYASRCISFFTGIFTVIREELINEEKGDIVSKATVMKWSEKMCQMESPLRGLFFKRVKEEYEQTMGVLRKMGCTTRTETKRRGDGNRKEASACGIEKLETGLVDLSIEDGKTVQSTGRGQPEPAPMMGKSLSEESNVIAGPELPGEQTMHGAYQKLIDVAPEFFGEASNTPKLVIALDEAHKLGKARNEYRPSHILCRVISSFTKNHVAANWVIFASTVAKVADFSAPAYMQPSLRISQGGEELFAPYSELDWDHLATPLREIKLQEVAQLGNIVGFGRPLWKTLLASGLSVSRLLQTAGGKLCYSTEFDFNDSTQVFAVLGQRFCLDIYSGNSKAVELHAKTVSSHLRYCLEISPDSLLQTTLYPSEPILSCAAAHVLYWTEKGHSVSTNLVPSLRRLWTDIEGGAVDIGKKGELVSRLVYLLAKDVFVRTPRFPQSTDHELLDCRMVPVVDYLEFMFGPSAVTDDVKNVFSGWHINFSHWITMSEAIKTKDSIELKTLLMRHWARTCAVQCCHNQKAIDKLIPMYKEPADSEDPYDGCMSYILISDRARKTSSKRDLESVSPNGAGIHDLHQPYIAILADLRLNGLEPKFALDVAKVVPSLRLYAPGVNAVTYPFLGTHDLEDAQGTLQKMLDPPQGSPGSGIKLLRGHVLYGDTTGTSNLEWEVKREERL